MRAPYRLLSAVLLMAGCRSAAPAGLSDADKAAIQKGTADSELHFNAKPADFKAHAAAYYAADAIFMPPNGDAIQGAEAIGTWMAGYPAINNTKFAIVDMNGSGDMAYVHGTYEMDLTAPGATVAVHDKGKYLEIWKKQTDGSWKVARDIFNSDIPLPQPDMGKKPAGKKKP